VDDPYAACSLKPVCPTKCLNGEMECHGGVDADGCPLANVCHKCHCPGDLQPVICGPDQMFCPGVLDQDPNRRGCFLAESCIPVAKFAVCQRFCPVSCPQPEFECSMPTDYNGCDRPPTCSTGGRFSKLYLL
jgi:hypothetical protein